VYDMYARFYRWAFDRLDNNGIVAFVTNRSFIDSRTFDGFRKTIQTEFDYAYIIDTKSDVRTNPKISGTGHNVFGIQTGVAIMILVKKLKRDNATCKIQYVTLDDFWKKEEKLQWFTENPLQKISFENIKPDKNNNWINLADNDFDNLLPLISKDKSLFSFSSLGTSTNRDEWVYDFNKETLQSKAIFFIDNYNKFIKKNITNDTTIKWSNTLKSHFKSKKGIQYDKSKIIVASYRPFTKQYYYSEKLMSDRLTANHYEIFGSKLNKENKLIGVLDGNRLDFTLTSNSHLPNLATFSLDPARWIPLYRYDENGNQIDNITDWGLNQFVKQYGKKGVTKETIFSYVYAVLHNQTYRKKYELNLKREFPRIPFYKDFKKWSDWGKVLMDLHINYETVKPFALKETNAKEIKKPKCKLKADKDNGTIILDEATTLTGIPKVAWVKKYTVKLELNI
jgi:predicted helicase